MALGQLPPWLNINPNDFLHATAAGTQMGHAIAEATQRAWENQQRMKMEEEHGQEVLAQQAIQNAMQRLAQDRLENYRQQEVANAQQGLEFHKSNAAEKIRHDLAREQTLDDAEKRKENYRRVIGVGGGLYRINSEGPPEVLVPPKPEVDTEEKDYERQLRTAQSALDVAKRNVNKFSATQPVTTGGGLFGLIPKSTTNQPVFTQQQTDSAKAAFDAAQTALDEKRMLLDAYKKSKGSSPASGTGITHRYNVKTGQYEAVDAGEPEPVE